MSKAQWAWVIFGLLLAFALGYFLNKLISAHQNKSKISGALDVASGLQQLGHPMTWLKSLWVWLVVAAAAWWLGWKIAKALTIVVALLILLVIFVPSLKARYARWYLGQGGLFDPVPQPKTGAIDALRDVGVPL